MKKKQNSIQKSNETDFYADALKDLDVPVPKKERPRKSGLLYGAIAAAVILIAAVLLIWQPWHGSDVQPTQPDTTPTEPKLPFANGIVFHYLPDVYEENDPSAIDQLELTGDEAQHLSSLLGKEKWFDMSMLSGEIYPIGSFELIQNGQSQVYEFTAGGLVTHEGKYARMVTSWPRLTQFMVQANDCQFERAYGAYLETDFSRRLYFVEDGIVSLMSGIRTIWRRSYLQVGTYILILEAEEPSALTMQMDGDSINYIEPYSDPNSEMFRHGDSFHFDPELLEKQYGYVSFGHTSGDMYFPMGGSYFSKDFFEGVCQILESLTWQVMDENVQRENLFGMDMRCYAHDDKRVLLNITGKGTLVLDTDRVLSSREATPTAEQMKELIGYISNMLGSIPGDVYQTKPGTAPAATITFQHEQRRFTFQEEGGTAREGTYLYLSGADSVSALLFFDDGDYMMLRKRYVSLDVYIDSMNREYSSDGKFPE